MDIKRAFLNYFEDYNFQNKRKIWKNHNSNFMDIWCNKISEGNAEKVDFDDLVFIIDTNARNSTKEDEAIAKTFIRYPLWYKLFADLNGKESLRKKVDEIFSSDNSQKVVDGINILYDINKENKNGLTTKSGIILNALLFLNKPEKYISSLSLNHRKVICDKLNITCRNNTIGDKIVDTNNKIIEYFKNFLNGKDLNEDQVFMINRMISDFIYSNYGDEYFWSNSSNNILNNNRDSEELENDEDELEKQEFYLEKYLEHFIYTNWDRIPELKDYDFIVNDDDEPISLQYRTDIGVIDLLVKNRKDNSYLVIELKRGKTSDKTIGQIARYIGWISENLAKEENVKVNGLIIAESFDEKIKYALLAFKNVKLMKYKVSFNLEYEK